MPAYWIARAKITDPATYKKYTDRVPEIISRYGGKVLARGGRHQIMAGPEYFQRYVVIEFPTFEQGGRLFRVAGVPGSVGLPSSWRRGGNRDRRGHRELGIRN